MVKRLNYLQTRDFMGAEIDEELPARLVVTGPNGSGKTKRILAIRLGLLGPEGNAGLAPWATGPNPVVSVTAHGLVISRKSALREGGAVKSKTELAPSLGEKTKAAVAIRIERDLAPNVLALELEALFGKSPKERRRAFLEALGGSSSYTPEQALEQLNEALEGNRLWTDVVAGELGPMKAAAPDGLALLSMVESAAKAQAGDARTRKRTAEALLKTPVHAPEGNLEEFEKERKEISETILELVAAASAASERVRAIAGLESERSRLLARFPAGFEVLNTEDDYKIGIEGFEADLAKADDEEDAAAILKRRWAKLQRFVEKAGAWFDVHATTKDDAQKAHQTATTERDEAAGFLKALESIVAHADEGSCPVCSQDMPDREDAPEGAAPEGLIEARERLSGLISAYAETRDKLKAAENVLVLAKSHHDRALDALQDEERAVEARTRVLAINAELVQIREAAQPFDEATLAAARDRKERIEERIGEIQKAQGVAAEREKVAETLEDAEADRRDAEAIQATAGPAGLSGGALQALVGGVMERAAGVFAKAYPDRTLSLRLEDERGNPDAFLAVTRDGKAFAGWGTASGGEKAVAAASLVVALSEIDPERLSVALIEAGEIDDPALEKLLEALSEEAAPALANVIVATHRTPTAPAAGFLVHALEGKVVA